MEEKTLYTTHQRMQNACELTRTMQGGYKESLARHKSNISNKRGKCIIQRTVLR